MCSSVSSGGRPAERGAFVEEGPLGAKRLTDRSGLDGPRPTLRPVRRRAAGRAEAVPLLLAGARGATASRGLLAGPGRQRAAAQHTQPTAASRLLVVRLGAWPALRRCLPGRAAPSFPHGEVGDRSTPADRVGQQQVDTTSSSASISAPEAGRGGSGWFPRGERGDDAVGGCGGEGASIVEKRHSFAHVIALTVSRPRQQRELSGRTTVAAGAGPGRCDVLCRARHVAGQPRDPGPRQCDLGHHLGCMSDGYLVQLVQCCPRRPRVTGPHQAANAPAMGTSDRTLAGTGRLDERAQTIGAGGQAGDVAEALGHHGPRHQETLGHLPPLARRPTWPPFLPGRAGGTPRRHILPRRPRPGSARPTTASWLARSRDPA